MSMFKRLGRSVLVQNSIGWLVALYLKFVFSTNRFVYEPQDCVEQIRVEMPAILAMWHGQHFLLPLAWKNPAHIVHKPKFAALVSRHGDGGLNAAILRFMKVLPVRGSGGAAHKMHRRGAVVATKQMLRLLKEETSVVLTADVPKKARECGLGIVTLAKLSGRPIFPVAVMTSRRFDFNSWDKASLSKPFGHGMVLVGAPIFVARDADERALEEARIKVEDSLNAIHDKGFSHCGGQDPGADLVKAVLAKRAAKTKGGEA